MPLLQRLAAYISTDKDTYRVLLRVGQSNRFIEKIRKALFFC